MIFYSWTALSDNGSTARSHSDSTGRSDGGLATLSDSGLAALTDGGSVVLSHGDRETLADSDPESAGSPVAMGITDDRGRAMKAAEETLGSGQAVVVIIEAVRPAMAAHTLAPCYVRTGVGWLGRCTDVGQVAWKRFFL
jgi:hypothetical protein